METHMDKVLNDTEGYRVANAYRQAGVDIEAGYESVERMKKHTARTARAGCIGPSWRIWRHV